MRTKRQYKTRLDLEFQKIAKLFHLNNAAARAAALREGVDPADLKNSMTLTKAVIAGRVRRTLVHLVEVKVATHYCKPAIPRWMRESIVPISGRNRDGLLAAAIAAKTGLGEAA